MHYKLASGHRCIASRLVRPYHLLCSLRVGDSSTHIGISVIDFCNGTHFAIDGCFDVPSVTEVKQARLCSTLITKVAVIVSHLWLSQKGPAGHRISRRCRKLATSPCILNGHFHIFKWPQKLVCMQQCTVCIAACKHVCICLI